MAAYVIIDIEVTDRESLQAYQAQAGSIMERYGGKFIARGGAFEVVEGDWQPHRLSIMEFESAEKAMDFYNSPEYAAIRPIRHRAAHTRVIVVQGI